uniref:Uncharacterized protein n=1 Tax=Arundo donax TaxID=35708 RepID=A0A0A9G6Q3_ARUDO
MACSALQSTPPQQLLHSHTTQERFIYIYSFREAAAMEVERERGVQCDSKTSKWNKGWR